MKYYSIQQDQSFSTWKVMLPQEAEMVLRLKQHITFKDFWTNSQVIPFKMVTNQLLVSTVIYGDIHRWQHDLSLGMAPQPNAYLLVVSPLIKSLLERFKAPIHQFYSAKAINYFNDSDQEKDLFVFHLKDQSYEELLYSQVEFGVFENFYNAPKLIRPYKAGEITSYAHYKELVNEVINRNSSSSLEPLSYIYEKAYDILWGPGSTILVNEEVKEVMLVSGIKGVMFKEFTKYKIIT